MKNIVVLFVFSVVLVACGGMSAGPDTGDAAVAGDAGTCPASSDPCVSTTRLDGVCTAAPAHQTECEGADGTPGVCLGPDGLMPTDDAPTVCYPCGHAHQECCAPDGHVEGWYCSVNGAHTPCPAESRCQ